MSTSPSELTPLLAFGAHPDDIEFGVGGVLAAEARQGRAIHLVVGSRGEAGTNGTPDERTAEAETAAKLLGATLEFVDLGGDANIEATRAGARQLAAIIRWVRPGVILAPTTEPDQHPAHAALGAMVRDAARLARYGGLEALQPAEPHAIAHLLYYAISPDAAPAAGKPLLYQLSDDDVAVWQRAMEAHASQMKTRDYVTLQLTRARLLGLNAGLGHAIGLYPNDPLAISSLGSLGAGSRRF